MFLIINLLVLSKIWIGICLKLLSMCMLFILNSRPPHIFLGHLVYHVPRCLGVATANGLNNNAANCRVSELGDVLVAVLKKNKFSNYIITIIFTLLYPIFIITLDIYILTSASFNLNLTSYKYFYFINFCHNNYLRLKLFLSNIHYRVIMLQRMLVKNLSIKNG